MKNRILIVDDEQAECVLLALALKKEYDVSAVNTAADCIRSIKEESFDVVLLDLMIGPSSGLDLLREIKKVDENTVVIMITAYGSIRTTVEAMSGGAFTYLTKPIDIDELKAHIRKGLENRKLNEEVDYLSGELMKERRYSEIIGDSPRMQEIYGYIDKLKDVASNVTIYGESGTGKELAARAIHYNGIRAGERFVAINCAAIPESLLEEELFGHRRGAFTGAVKDKKGILEIADGGSIFLDEIGDMPLNLQGKILRAIQDKEFMPIGSTAPVKVNVRIIAATNKDLGKLVKEGNFREDLFYRLNVFAFTMPPLRERREDIPELCRYFIEKYNAEMNKNITGISNEAGARLKEYNYPGNVRQLSNIIEHAMILATGSTIEQSNLPGELQQKEENTSGTDEKAYFAGKTFEELEKKAIVFSLEKNGGRRDITAAELGISVRTLQNKMHLYDIK